MGQQAQRSRSSRAKHSPHVMWPHGNTRQSALARTWAEALRSVVAMLMASCHTPTNDQKLALSLHRLGALQMIDTQSLDTSSH